MKVGRKAVPPAYTAAMRLGIVVAVSLGILSAPESPVRLFHGPHSVAMTSLPWILIPGFLVPLLFLCHVAVIARLRVAPRPLAAT